MAFLKGWPNCGWDGYGNHLKQIYRTITSFILENRHLSVFLILLSSWMPRMVDATKNRKFELPNNWL